MGELFQAMLIEGKGGPAFYEAGSVAGFTCFTQEVPHGCSLCVAMLLCSFVMLMISLRKLKIERTENG